MATVLNTVSDFVAEARVLLQDTVIEYRYPDVDILAALNNGLQEAIRIRQFLFRSNRSDALSSDRQYKGCPACRSRCPLDRNPRQLRRGS